MKDRRELIALTRELIALNAQLVDAIIKYDEIEIAAIKEKMQEVREQLAIERGKKN